MARMPAIKLKDTDAFKAMAQRLLLAEAELANCTEGRMALQRTLRSIEPELAAYKAFAEAAELADRITYFVEAGECLSGALTDLRAELERLKS